MTGTAEGLLEDLSPAQVAAVRSDAAPLAIVAGPGSGKTRVLTRRVAYRCVTGSADPNHTLVLTFSRRAAGELLARLGRLGLPAGRRGAAGVRAGTFHAMAWDELVRTRAERRLPPLGVAGRPGRLLREAIAQVTGTAPHPDDVRAVATEFGRVRSAGEIPTGDVWEAYGLIKRRRRVVDLDDILVDCVALLREDREAAAIARWRYRHVFVDEYQDLNPVHLTLLQLWVGGRPDLCVVGDPHQSIYGFNGSIPGVLDRADRDWPGVRVLELPDNFRSTPELAAFSGAVVGRNRSHGSRPPGPLPSLHAYPDPDAEAAGIAEAIVARRVPGRGCSGMAVLARTNARLLAIAEALAAVGVPWRVRDRRALADQPEVGALLDSAPGTAPAAVLLDELPFELGAVAVALGEFRMQSPAGTVGGFAAWLDASGFTADQGTPGGVELATFHRAKGLEWRSVWVTGLESIGRTAEDARLLYVALTRAEEELAVSWSGPQPPAADPLRDALARLAATPSPEEQRRRFGQLAGLLA